MFGLLGFKLFVTPTLLLSASMASKRWGEKIGGLLIGLPLTSGPISVLLALEYGPAFAAHATAGALTATIAQTVFCLAYCKLATRGWPTALCGAVIGFASCAAAIQRFELTPFFLYPGAMIASALVLKLTAVAPHARTEFSSPWWDMPARVGIVTALVICVTSIAAHLGPSASGVVSAVPLMVAIMTAFSHRVGGKMAACQVLRGVLTGLFGFSTFFFVLSVTLVRVPLAFAYLISVTTALLTQGLVLFYVARKSGSIRS